MPMLLKPKFLFKNGSVIGAVSDIATLLGMLRQRLGGRLQIEDLPPLTWLEPPQVLQISRIVQEIISNILKHAQANNIHFKATSIKVLGSIDSVKISIADDGIGFDGKLKDSGRGLKNLQSRANEIGAKITTHTAIGQGTTVEIRLPIHLK